MGTPPLRTLVYRRAAFATQLPVDFRYSATHGWAAPVGDGLWRVGLTKFGVRRLGEMVDHGFELTPGAIVQVGQLVGWIEGFKAISDLLSPAAGTFAGSNPVLHDRLTVINRDPYREGWIYAVRGEPDPQALDVQAYGELLDRTIDRLCAAQKEAGNPCG